MDMFSFIGKDGCLAIRLAKEERELFIKQHQLELCIAYGAVMKEYVAIPDELLSNTREMNKIFKVSYEYVKSLKPKSSKRKK